MGPQRSLSALINEVQSQTDEVRSFTHRLRTANKRLTGGTGEEPPKLSEGRGPTGATIAEVPPLMVALSIAVEALNGATSDLRAEVTYLENLSETNDGDVSPAKSTDRGFERRSSSRLTTAP